MEPDRSLNALTDWGVRVAPAMWWPAAPPRRRRPLAWPHHAVFAVWSVAGVALGEAYERRYPSPGPVSRDVGRAASVLLVAWYWRASTRAWNRRAERLRRPWTRLLG